MPKKKAKKAASKKKAPVRRKPAAKKPVRRVVKKAAPKTKKAVKKKKAAAVVELPWREPLAGEKFVGVVEDFYSHIGVITLTLKGPLAVGDRIHVRGYTTDITQTVNSMQIEHASVPKADRGAAIGIRISDKCRRGDYIYRIS